MALRADGNLYPGINIHLNSYLQNEPGGWRSFHSQHITDLARTIDEVLPPGYYTRSEKSLQIGEFDAGSGSESKSQTTPDVTVFRHSEQEDELTGLVIYQAGEGSILGRPITRVELLSPANKPRGSHHEQYMVKRQETLKSGLRLLEIDYLHATPPLIQKLPDYSQGAEGAKPYNILVSDPRPTFEQGKTDVYLFGVDDPLPVINVPLAGADTVKVDFGKAYNRTFESSRFFLMVVDYEQEPVQFERYTEADKARIQQRLTIIRNETST